MKTINILVGQKGSGKTYIGKLLQDNLNIPFLRVEDVCLKIKKDRDVFDKNYIAESFMQIEKEIRKLLNTTDQLTIESTGAAVEFTQMLENLKKDFIVKLIKVDTDSELCIQRVRDRDNKNHIPVSDERVSEINKLAVRKIFDFDLIINNNCKTDKEILNEIKKIISTTA